MESVSPITISALHSTEAQTLSSREYLLVLNLSGTILLQGHKPIDISSGTLVFLAPFSGLRLQMGAESDSLYAVIPAAFLEPQLGIPRRSYVILSQDSNDTVREKMIELFDLSYNQNARSPLQYNRTVYELLCALEPAIANDNISDHYSTPGDERSQQMLAFLDAHFRSQVTLGDLADAFSMSRAHISMIFHRDIGISFSDYLTRIRLEEGLRLLLTTRLGITEIAMQSGFPNIKAFNQAFSKKHGVSPKEYRKQRSEDQYPAPSDLSGSVLRNINQLLQRYAPIYQRQESEIRITHTINAGEHAEWTPHWDILNVDNVLDCLQSDAQDALRQLQERLHFRYVRLSNVISSEITPYIPTVMHHRFTLFFRLIDFFRSINLIPMLSFGNNNTAIFNAIFPDYDGYSLNADTWSSLLCSLLDASIARWGEDWVSQWRFEFYMPSRLYGSTEPDSFVTLFEKSAAEIKRRLPRAEVGGPALSIDTPLISRWDAWFRGIREHRYSPDFISLELWADFEIEAVPFSDYGGNEREMFRLKALNRATTSLVMEKLETIRTKMNVCGLSNTKLYVSAFGITKYHATAAQVGGHCAAYIAQCNLALNDLVDGIGCWKALNAESEYGDEKQIIAQGCGLYSRNNLKNLSYYAYDFLSALMPFHIDRNTHSIVTTNGKDCFSVILHNCKEYSTFFCNNYLERRGIISTDSRHYSDNAALTQTFNLHGTTPGTYLVKQYLLGDHHGSIVNIMSRLGEVRALDETELQYVAGQALPYLHAYRLIGDGTLSFQVTLQPNEVMLLIITPASDTFFQPLE